MKAATRIVLALLVMATAAIALSIAAQADDDSDPTPNPALEEFIPSEKLPADSAVSFPVDI